jgi:hypothetical protein
MCKYDGESEAALGSRRRRRRRKKKNSPLLHKSIEWGQKPLGTENAAGKKKKQKKRKKEREQTQLHKYMTLVQTPTLETLT